MMTIDDFFDESEKTPEEIVRKPKSLILWFKATNGSGKSTIPHYMLENSKDIKYIKDGKKILATIFPKFGFASVGGYEKGKTFGGCDSLHKEQILKALELLKTTEYDIIVEGILTGAGTVGTGKTRNGESYYEVLKNYPRKNRIYLFIDIEWDIVLKRIQTRTGKTDSQLDELKNVKTKWDACKEHRKTYERLGEIECQSITNNSTKENFIKEFFERF